MILPFILFLTACAPEPDADLLLPVAIIALPEATHDPAADPLVTADEPVVIGEPDPLVAPVAVPAAPAATAPTGAKAETDAAQAAVETSIGGRRTPTGDGVVP